MQFLLAILIGKLIVYFSRLFRIGGGSAAPGLFALKIYPDLVGKLSKHIPRNVIITGTNGKTTTARMLAHFAQEAGLKVIRNHTGSNLERGIASALISHYTLYPKPYLSFGKESSAYTLDLGIWELDEAAFNTVALKLKPDIVVFLNVFRDQLDRYGEVNSVVQRWCETLNKLDHKTVVLVNGDDINTAKLRNCFKGQVKTFGVKDYKIVGESLEHIKHPHKLDFEAKNIKLNGLASSSFDFLLSTPRLRSGQASQFSVSIPIPGIYHIYDAVAAIACAYNLNLPVNRLIDSLIHFSPAFGRVEKLPFGYIFLIKNPAGATQVFETIAPQIKKEDRLLIALNDNLADGTDVSWIWDAEFEKLLTLSLRDHEVAKQSSKLNRLPRSDKIGPRNDVSVVCSGTRAYDLAVRLKYVGFQPKILVIEPDLRKALKASRLGLKGKLFILPTYTALLELQKILVKEGIKQHYWKES